MVLLPNIIWIDPNVEGEENSSYIGELQSMGYHKIRRFKDCYTAVEHIKTIEFEETIIIVSGSLYINFIQEFKNNLNDIYVIPKIIIFTANKDSFINNIGYQNLNYINDPFYNIHGIQTNFEDIKKFIEHPIGDNKLFLYRNDEELNFEYIESKEQLYLPLFYKSLIEIKEVDKLKIQKFTNSLYEKYGKKSKELEELLNPIHTMHNIPIELLSKYYSRIYTIESPFYSDLNNSLRENERDYYLPFIKVLYEGVKLNSLQLASNDKLYRGTKLLNKEIEEIKKCLNNKKEGLPGAIIFSKTFSSFTKEKKIAEHFLNTTNTPKGNTSDNFSKVLFILEKDDSINYNLATHADIERLSVYSVEREV